MPFIENETFSDASTYTGTYNIARFTLAYRIRCAENYYGDKCDIYCVDTDSNCGHYKCNCERKKECDDGYMNNKINCTEIGEILCTNLICKAIIIALTRITKTFS